MKRWRHRERLGDLIESARGEYVLFDEAERYGGSEYARGYANGSGDEGYYQREIARLRGTLSLAEEGLANYAEENEQLKALLWLVPRDLVREIDDWQIGALPQSAVTNDTGSAG